MLKKKAVIPLELTPALKKQFAAYCCGEFDGKINPRIRQLMRDEVARAKRAKKAEAK